MRIAIPERFAINSTTPANEASDIAIDGDVATYSWSEGDKVGFYYVDTDATGKKKKNSKTISIDGRTATFTTEFEALEGATNYNIGAFYPGSSWDTHSDTEAFNNVRVKIAAAQSLTENTFDPKADLMMSKPFMNVALENDSVKSLEFTRIAAIGKMNLKLEGMESGEVIKKVKFSVAEDAQFNGIVVLDLENSTYTLSEEGAANYVELTGGLVANADRTAIFFTCFPGEYVGAYTIEVETDKASYSKEGTLNNALTFTAGNVLNFDATVGNRKESDIKIYTKLTNANLADYSGTYLLVYEAGNVAFNGSLTTLDATNNHHAVVIDNGTITGAYSASTFTIAKVEGGYSIQSASGKYIGRSATSNGLNSADSYSVDYLNTIENLVIKGKGGNALQYNATSGQERFRYFKTTQKAIALYRQNGTGSDEEIELVQLSMPTDLVAEANGNVVTVTWDAVENATNYDVTVGDKTTNVTTNSATLTLDYEKKYTIEVVAKGGVGYTDSEAASVSVTTGVKTGGETGGETTTTYTFSSYTAGTQYAKNEAHELDNVLTITTTECHFTSELRIYSSSSHDGYAIGTLAEGHTIKSLGFNAGYKADTLNVYGSTDGSEWTLVAGVGITSTSYKDYSVDFGDTNYTYFKLDVAGSNQVRLASLTLTYQN